MNASSWWWVAAGLLMAAELLTGTFFLFMLALSAAMGAIAALLGLDMPYQFTVAALTGIVSTSVWSLQRRYRGADPQQGQSDRNLNLDIGQTVHVGSWDAQGGAQVLHRGAHWRARYAGKGTPEPGAHRIKSLHGSILELEVL